MALELNVRRVGDVTLVMCKGRIVAGAEAAALERQMTELLDFDRLFVLHLAEVNFVDSSGLGLLVRLMGMTKARRGDLKLCNVARDVDHTLTITNLKRILETHASEVEAIRAFYQPSKQAGEAPQGGKHVLCIDQSANVLAMLREILRHAGHSPITTNNLYDARVLLAATRPGLVIVGPNIPAEKVQAVAAAIGATPNVTLAAGFETLDAGEASQMLLRMVEEKLGA